MQDVKGILALIFLAIVVLAILRTIVHGIFGDMEITDRIAMLITTWVAGKLAYNVMKREWRKAK